jgi:Secretion system C-terminal sorting domain
LNAQKIYVGTSDANVWMTANDGTNWSNITGTLPNRYVTSIHASPNVANNVYVTHTGYKFGEYIPHIHKSINNGTTWIDISGNLPQAGINDVLIVPGNENNLFVANDIGVYVTYDAGINWYRVGNNMPIISVWDIAYNATTQRLVAGTYAKSLQTIDVTTLTTGIAALNKNTPELLVYPSIVTNNELHIKTNDHGNNSKASIIDLSGKTLIVVDIDAELTNVDLSNFAVGAYFVKLSSEKGTTVKRIIKQ